MAWIRLGRNTIYLSSNVVYRMLENYYTYVESDKDWKLHRLLYDKKRNKKEVKHFIRYFENVLSANERREIINLNLTGEKAQEEILELLWAYCESHEGYRLAKRSENGLYYPRFVDIRLDNTFGSEFYITKTIKKRSYLFFVEEEMITSHVDVHDLIGIYGTFDSITIVFNNMILFLGNKTKNNSQGGIVCL